MKCWKRMGICGIEPMGSFLVASYAQRKGWFAMDVEMLLVAMGIPSAFTGFCFWMLERKLDRRQRDEERKDEARRRNEVIVIEGVNAAIALGEATAKAVQRIPDAKCNGDMAAALRYASEVKHKHKDFMTEQGVDALY